MDKRELLRVALQCILKQDKSDVAKAEEIMEMFESLDKYKQ